MKVKRTALILTLALIVMMALAACGGSETIDEVEEIVNDDTSATGSEGSGAALPPAPESGPKVEVTRASAAVTTSETVVDSVKSEAVVEGEEASRDSFASSPPVEVGGAAGAAAAADAAVEVELTLQQESRLTAGEVDDNAQWDDYLLYLRDYSGAAVIRLDVSERHLIQVQDAQGNPVLSARITIEANGQEVTVLRTHSNGQAYFFPRLFDTSAGSYTVNVEVDQVIESFDIPAGGAQREWIVTHSAAADRQPQARLDVLFLIDATGSMADEINQLKENILSISAQIDALPQQPDVRYGMVTYRDQGDEYVARVTDFTPRVDQFSEALAQVFADGGGDYPEDLNEALSQAVHGPEWRTLDTVQLIFLVADAPPHLDYGQENHYGVELQEANKLGIKIFPIASSGLDSQGEYIFRQLAQVTGGRFIFLTYGAEGPGSTGTETEFDVSDYTVSSLDALVVKIVEEELAFLQR